MTDEPTSLTVRGTLDGVIHIRRWLEGVLSGWQVAAQVTSDLELAVTELCTNIVRHGYGGQGRGDITVAVSRRSSSIRVTVEDGAPPFEPEATALPAPEALQEGGYGLSLVHHLLDEVAHERLGQRGNRTILIKHEHPAEAE
jgi:anti-sigma regulatory factor (Ser/Thr protein kinase)